MLLALSTLALAEPCQISLSVHITPYGTPIEGADELLYGGTRPALRDTPLACSKESCHQALDYDWKALQGELSRVKQACPAHERVTLVAQEDTRYDTLSSAARVASEVFSEVMIGGTVAVSEEKPGAQQLTLTAHQRHRIDGVETSEWDFGAGEVIELQVEAPAELPFSELRPALRTASEAGYRRFVLARENGQVVAKVAANAGGSLAKVVKGKLSAAQVQAGVVGIQGQLGECYNAALARDPSAGGAGSVEFRIQADGSVSSTSMASGGFQDAELQQCVLDAFMQAKFDEPGGVLTGTFPLTLAVE